MKAQVNQSTVLPAKTCASNGYSRDDDHFNFSADYIDFLYKLSV
jgi:hypothetical protein